MSTLTAQRASRPEGVPACVPRWRTPRNLARPTLGPRVAQVAELVGITLMPWQKEVLNTALEVDPETGQLVYREIRLTVPRQSGKTTLLLALMTHRCIGFGERQRVAFTMQSRQDARQKLFEDYKPVLEASSLGPSLDVRESNGMERIMFPNGSIWGLVSSTEKSGHGPTVDLGVVDEAFAQIDGRVEQGMKPSMITRGSAQFWVVSTAGTNESSYLNDKIKSGRLAVERKVEQGVCYFEWSADPEKDDPADEDTWWRCMPALGITVPIEAIRADFESMDLDEFKRAYLNIMHDKRKVELWKVLDKDDWMACLDEDSMPRGEITFAIDASPDRSRAAISVAGNRAIGGTHIEVVRNGSGMDWVVPAMKGLWERRQASFIHVVIDKKSAARTFIPELVALGIPVLEVGVEEHTSWCGVFFDAISEHTVAHRGQGPLTAAAAGAIKRASGDAWLWDRRSPSTDITPLVSATLAHGAHLRATPAESSGPIFAY